MRRATIEHLESKEWRAAGMSAPDYLAIELDGVAAMLNALALQYDPGADRLSEEENENALYAAQQQLRRIAEDLRAFDKTNMAHNIE